MAKLDIAADLEGQIMALGAILRGVMSVMPDRAEMLQQVKSQLEYLQTAVLSSRMPDETLEGIERIKKEVLAPPLQLPVD